MSSALYATFLQQCFQMVPVMELGPPVTINPLPTEGKGLKVCGNSLYFALSYSSFSHRPLTPISKPSEVITNRTIYYIIGMAPRLNILLGFLNCEQDGINLTYLIHQLDAKEQV